MTNNRLVSAEIMMSMEEFFVKLDEVLTALKPIEVAFILGGYLGMYWQRNKKEENEK